jgi:hypothetical protein
MSREALGEKCTHVRPVCDWVGDRGRHTDAHTINGVSVRPSVCPGRPRRRTQDARVYTFRSYRPREDTAGIRIYCMEGEARPVRMERRAKPDP